MNRFARPLSPTNLPTARLGALATAVPRHVLQQEAVAAGADRIFAGNFSDFSRLRPVYANAEIDTRHSCVPIDWYHKPHSFTDRNQLYIENAVELLAAAAEQALAEGGLTFADIDGLVVASSSGIATPSLDALLMQRLRLRRDMQRLPIFGLGCAGGVIGLSRTAQLARGAPDKRYLFLVVELCGLNFRFRDRSKSNVIATALFGDGAAAAVVSCREAGPALTAWGEHTWLDSLDVMGWDVTDDGLKVVFSRDIPALIRKDMRAVVDAFLTSHDLTLPDIDGFICHPGGAKVLDALEEVFELQQGGLVHSRDVLRRFGNMSAATVMFVLQATLAGRARGRHLMSTLGPGFTSGLLLLEAG
ncbi:MAG TPA: 3-oxoacyl-[acyl-carrier-protein] synthase III C-terminal domain-containing protein [Candidatus Sulfotelmatobacter sp.]|nr:3-oxoacyl-[acyl-carrier-protein] synthase III C-terminal domain-containing protein [Candidatus Sulfotelmatobacter sp.]